MSAAEKKYASWFQFPAFDFSSLLSPQASFAPIQEWLKDQKLMDPGTLWPGTPFFPDFSKAGMEWYSVAAEQMQTVLEEYWKLMGLIPQNEYDRLLEQYNAIKRKLEEEQQKKEKKTDQDTARLKESQEALKAAEHQIKKLEEELKAIQTSAESKKETAKAAKA